jgi:hypothetical protein
MFSLLQPLRESAQITRSNLHHHHLARAGIEYALLLDICPPGAAGMAHGMASGVTESGLLAGFFAYACHKLRDFTYFLRLGQ